MIPLPVNFPLTESGNADVATCIHIAAASLLKGKHLSFYLDTIMLLRAQMLLFFLLVL